MKKKLSPAAARSMSPDAFAGFLRLWLTPASAAPAPSADIDAYLAHANRREPLPAHIRHAVARLVDEAA